MTRSRQGTGSTVVIPCHNAASTLGEQLEALATQEYSGEFETVIIDNLSTDDLDDVVGEYESRVPGIRVIRAEERANLGYARNVGVMEARYDRILFCDGDDVVSRRWVASMASALDHADLVTGPLDLDALNPKEVAASRGAQTDGLQNMFGFLPHGTGGNSAVWRDVHTSFGGFDEEIPSLEDTDYFWKAQLAGFEVAYVPEAVIHYRLRTDFKGILRQARQYAVADVLLHKRYRPEGLEPIRLWSGIKGWVRVAMQLPKAISARGRARLAWLLGYRLGRIKGAFRYRTLAL